MIIAKAGDEKRENNQFNHFSTSLFLLSVSIVVHPSIVLITVPNFTTWLVPYRKKSDHQKNKRT